jgi:multimeric flavodoxin WrbA
VEYLQDVLSNMGNDVETHYVRDTDPKSLAPADLFVLSAPTHARSIPGKMKKFMKKADSLGGGARYAAMTTFNDKSFVLEQMDKRLSSKGAVKAAEGIQIRVGGMKGPLEEGYQQKLDEFASRLVLPE